ncbi:hypothetical protein [Streptomyces sp. NPDC059398]|uniref:hypothetical protein n=1 Tax=Streptomyces sp. NPDC059398 TaxID=3346820 RepID=UPI0036A6DD87
MRAQEQRNDNASSRGAVRRTTRPGAPGGLLALQRSAGNAAVVRAMEERHTHGAGCGHAPSVQRMPAPEVPPKPARLTGNRTGTGDDQEAGPAQPAAPAHGYTLTSAAGTMEFFRADSRSPDALRKSGGMRAWRPSNAKSELSAFLADPVGYSQAHVRSPKRELVSMANNEECGGYASADRHIYKISVSGLNRFDGPPARSKLLAKPTLYANSTTLESATVVVMGPIGPTQEMDYFGDIPMSNIVSCRKPGESGFTSP